MKWLSVFVWIVPFVAFAETYSLPVLPAEHRQIQDPVTGVELNFLTTDPGRDANIYIYQQEWLQDGSIILFNSSRNNGAAMGYITKTGELVKFISSKGALGAQVASVKRPVLFGRCGRDIVEVALRIDTSVTPSIVTADERVICQMPEGDPVSFLTESPDGTKLVMGMQNLPGEHKSAIYTFDIATGSVEEACGWTDPKGFMWHVQWSWTDPDLLIFAGIENRLMAVNIKDKKPRCLYEQRPEEVVTHETAWVNNQLLFCGGTHPKPTEDGHVKVMDLATGAIRILGAGAWWADTKPIEIAKVNWWHCSGSRDGRWAAADNWHGDIMIWEAKTTRPRLLTTGHRTYGQGEHPHVSWDQAGKAVVFTSEMFGNGDVCVATIPEEWQAQNITEPVK